jgi:NADPH-dependent 2,4-dienoyl-CoA reductase/sulfur reductase-like enzyme
VSFSRGEEGVVVRTKNGRRLSADFVIVGVGIRPAVKLAEAAGLAVQRGVVVDEYLQTSQKDIFAVGDSAFFPYPALKRSLNIEHWDNAQSQGRLAGRNMAGAPEPFRYMPSFFSNFFDFSCQGVGDVDSRHTTVSDWEKKNERGTVYYLDQGRVVGALLCNREGIDEAREAIRSGKVAERVLAGVR